ncbi:MAG: N-acetylmuramoyl-L-alanine amidase [Calditrichaeota bacterium]|nr:N-acetylmuramoyl-L-alanine amidase [Candidatus Cloacimonadota bacterium]MCB1046017.1 N-acetylmuramoyl-L-alanine amidase [Calditrichota bacterium]MCB9473119.1 N-acetylmuramoyl-L-alanine amidase [Candidatus Delongbacteria bacterium]
MIQKLHTSGRLAGRPVLLLALLGWLCLAGLSPAARPPEPAREYLLTVVDASGDSLPEILPTWARDGRRLICVEDLARLLRLQLEITGARRELSSEGGMLRAEGGNRFVMLNGVERVLPGPAFEDADGLLLDHQLLAVLLESGLLVGSLDSLNEELVLHASRAGLLSEALQGGHLLRLRLGELPTFDSDASGRTVVLDFSPSGVLEGSALDHIWRGEQDGLLEKLQVRGDRLELTLGAQAELVDVIEAESLGEIQVLLRRRGAKLSEEFQPPPAPELVMPQGQPIDLDVIVIDAGHGGKDPGAVSPRGSREKDVTLAVARRLRDELRERLPDTRIVMTREDDRFLELAERTQLANKAGGKLFISIHANAARNRSARGWEVYFLRPGKNQHAREVALRENSVLRFEENAGAETPGGIGNWILASMAQSAYVEESQNLAALIYRSMRGVGHQRPRPVLQQGFYVLVGASMPAVLFETGFITNPEDEKQLTSAHGQAELARALATSVVEFKELYGAAGTPR